MVVEWDFPWENHGKSSNEIRDFVEFYPEGTKSFPFCDFVEFKPEKPFMFVHDPM
jgi:hypothetical protein